MNKENKSMKSFPVIWLAALGFGLLSTVGCNEADDPTLAPSFVYPTKSSMQGGSGTNGNYSFEFQDTQDELYDIMSRRLKATGSNVINSQSEYILDTEAGVRNFRYAAGCALSVTDFVIGGTPWGTYEGQGFMSTTIGWGSNALDTSQQEDLFTCMVARLNPHGAEVPIWLSGANVQDDPNDDETPFVWLEAVWTTEVSALAINFHVWPLADLVNKCGAGRLIEGLNTRVCGTPTGNCVTVHVNSLQTDCTLTGGNYTCLNRPAIQTKLRLQDVSTMYDRYCP
jgi:hypothetical protein